MAKKKQVKITFQDWVGVDAALKRMAELSIAVEKLEGKMTLQMNSIREEFQGKIEPLNKELVNLDEGVRAFAEERKAEFAKVRTRELNFGTISFRVKKSLYVRNNKATVAALKALGLQAYLRTTEEPDKEKLDGLADTDLAKIGVTRKTDDKLSVEPNIDRIRKEAA